MAERSKTILFVNIRGHYSSYDIGPIPATMIHYDILNYFKAKMFVRDEIEFHKLVSGYGVSDSFVTELPCSIELFPKILGDDRYLIIKSFTENGQIQLEWDAQEFAKR